MLWNSDSIIVKSQNISQLKSIKHHLPLTPTSWICGRLSTRVAIASTLMWMASVRRKQLQWIYTTGCPMHMNKKMLSTLKLCRTGQSSLGMTCTQVTIESTGNLYKPFPVCVNMGWSSCVFRPAGSKQNATWSTNFTQPAKGSLKVPCSSRRVSSYELALCAPQK